MKTRTLSGLLIFMVLLTACNLTSSNSPTATLAQATLAEAGTSTFLSIRHAGCIAE